MTNSNRFPNISARVLNALDRDFPGWQDLVPAEKDVELNEESLIKLLKDRKRAEIYRTVADKRNAFMKEAYEGSDKSFAELTREFASFSYEQTHKWIDMEGKLSSIILEFRAKAEPIDFGKMDEDLDAVSKSFERHIDNSVSGLNSYMDAHLNSFLGRSVDGVPREGSDDLVDFLKTKVEQFKEENKRIGNKQKEFINNSVKKAIQNKVEKIRSGELPEDALNRSDLFTDEEINELKTAQERIVIDAIKERKQSNINTMNEAAQKFLGVSGKEGIVQKMGEFPEDIISPEIKQIVEEAFDRGGMFPDEKNSQSNRSKRSAWPDVASLMLDYASSKLEQMAKIKEEEHKQSKLYQSCKTQWWMYLSPVWAAVCGIHISVVDSGVSQQFYYYLSKTLSCISFVISLFSASGWIKRIKKLIKFSVSQICGEVGFQAKDAKVQKLSTLCSATIFLSELSEVIADGVPGVAAKVMLGIASVGTAKDVISELSND